MLKANFLLLYFFIAGNCVQAQDEKKNSNKGTINIEFTAGVNNTTPLGIDAKAARNSISKLEGNYGDYKGGLFPKTAAYGGILLDYRFHEIGALGFGLIYTPKGYWLFEKGIQNPSFIDQRKTFVTVDYFDMPVFFKIYLREKKLGIRFGPVVSFGLLSKVRITTEFMGEKTKEKYRLGEGTNDTIFYDGLVNEVPKFIVPGFETALYYGKTPGFQGTVVIGFSGSMFENADLKSFIARLGFNYTISK